MLSKSLATAVKSVVVAVATVAALATTATAAQAARAEPVSAASFGACDDHDPQYNTDSITLSHVYSGSALIELRYSPSARCAWGRIGHFSGNMVLWVDRSFDGGRTWQGPMFTVYNSSGAYTLELDDAGVVMRACGQASGSPVRCTAWR